MFKNPASKSEFFSTETPSKKHFHHPIAIPIGVTLVMLIIFSFIFLVYGGKTLADADVKRVEVYVDGKTKIVPTRAKTVGQLLERLNVQTEPGDVIEPGLNSPILDDDLLVSVYKAKPVTVVDENGATTTAKVAESSPHELARKAGVDVYDEDKVVFAEPGRALKNGVVGDLVLIKRSFPATINLYGKDIVTRTTSENVADFLKEKNILTQSGDSVVPSADTKVKKGMKVFVLRPGQKIVNEEEPIEPPTERRFDATLEIGTTNVVAQGRPGVRLVTYQIEVKKGKVTSRKKIQSVVSLQPKPRVVVEGTKVDGFSGSFEAALARLRGCEGSYSSNTGNGYYGAYQFSSGTWGGYGGYSNASEAPPAVQDQKAFETYQARGWSPWPACSSSLGLQDVYR